MMARGHAVSGATVWLTGWAWGAMAGTAHPRADVLIVGTLVCAGAALLPDFDHPSSRLAHSGGLLTWWIALAFGWFGAGVHAATKLDADRSDRDGHRTITHTIVFAALAGCVTAGIAGLSDNLGAVIADKTGIPALAPTGKSLAAVLVYVFVQLGAATIRANFGGRRKKVRPLGKKGPRIHKATLIAVLAAAGSYILVPADVWWLGMAVGTGCFAHLLGDVITAAGCPVLWPIPLPATVQKYDPVQHRRVPTRVWRTWYLVGTPQWMRFRVGSPTEARVTWGIVVFGVLAVAGLVYAGGWGPGAS